MSTAQSELEPADDVVPPPDDDEEDEDEDEEDDEEDDADSDFEPESDDFDDDSEPDEPLFSDDFDPFEPESDVDPFAPRLSVLKNPDPLKVTPTGWKTFFTGRTSPESGWAYSLSVSSVNACWTSMVSPVSTNL